MNDTTEPAALRAYRVPGERHYPRRLREGEYVVTDANVALTTGEEIVVLTKTGRRLIAELIGHSDGILILSGLADQDDGGVWVDVSEIDRAEAVVMFYFKRALPPGTINAGDLTAPLQHSRRNG